MIGILIRYYDLSIIFLLQLKSEDIISMFKNASGQGEAIVVFPTSQQAQQAVDEKQRKYIGKNFLKLSLKHL